MLQQSELNWFSWALDHEAEVRFECCTCNPVWCQSVACSFVATKSLRLVCAFKNRWGNIFTSNLYKNKPSAITDTVIHVSLWCGDITVPLKLCRLVCCASLCENKSHNFQKMSKYSFLQHLCDSCRVPRRMSNISTYENKTIRGNILNATSDNTFPECTVTNVRGW